MDRGSRREQDSVVSVRRCAFHCPLAVSRIQLSHWLTVNPHHRAVVTIFDMTTPLSTDPNAYLMVDQGTVPLSR